MTNIVKAGRLANCTQHLTENASVHDSITHCFQLVVVCDVEVVPVTAPRVQWPVPREHKSLPGCAGLREAAVREQPTFPSSQVVGDGPCTPGEAPLGSRREPCPLVGCSTFAEASS